MKKFNLTPQSKPSDYMAIFLPEETLTLESVMFRSCCGGRCWPGISTWWCLTTPPAPPTSSSPGRRTSWRPGAASHPCSSVTISNDRFRGLSLCTALIFNPVSTLLWPGLSLFWSQAEARSLTVQMMNRLLCRAPARLAKLEHCKGEEDGDYTIHEGSYN